MSQVVTPEEMTPENPVTQEPESQESISQGTDNPKQEQPEAAQDTYSTNDNTFDYKPVPISAPISLALGAISGLTIITPVAGIVAVLGLLVGFMAWRNISGSEGLLGGALLAKIGMGLSLIFILAGTVWHSFAYATEVPEGFTRVSFSQEIAEKKFIIRDGVQEIHPDVQALEDQEIFLKGYMYPTQRTEGLTSFIFVKDNGQCCFGGQPALTDMILVKMKPGKTVNFYPTRVSVAGKFKSRGFAAAGNLSPVYELEAGFFERSKTSF